MLEKIGQLGAGRSGYPHLYDRFQNTINKIHVSVIKTDVTKSKSNVTLTKTI